MTQASKVVTLSSVIVKIRHIADVHYEAKLYDNIVSIFQRLNPTEQRVLLKGLIGMCSTIEDKILEEKGYERNDGSISLPHPNDRRKSRVRKEKATDAFDNIKQSKGWWWKISGAVALIVFLMTTSLGTFFLTGEHALLARLIHFVEVVKSVF